MTPIKDNSAKPFNMVTDKHYRDLLKKNFFRLFLSYIAPLIMLVVFFEFQYDDMLKESKDAHYLSVAESQSNIMDLFLRERIINLTNLIENPNINFQPSDSMMSIYLDDIKKNSPAFIDLGFFDEFGIQSYYAGPYQILENKDYSKEHWYKSLTKSHRKFIITDIYTGFRNNPHFTIGVKKTIGKRSYVIRATLDPEKINEYIQNSTNSKDVSISVINSKGYYQIVQKAFGKVTEKSGILIEGKHNKGVEVVKILDEEVSIAYCKLNMADWLAIVRSSDNGKIYAKVSSAHYKILIISLVVFFILFILIYLRAKNYVKIEKEKDIARSQLEHAAKLASVGELAAGIAHEINNPLAIISSETGLIQDMLDPRFNLNISIDEIRPRLDNIKEATYRCRDITRKLLGFVRNDGITFKKHKLSDIINETVNGFFEKGMEVSNIEFIQDYNENIPEIVTDANQLKQVLVNLIKNAMDAIEPPGKIMISTDIEDNKIIIAVTDTGCGMDDIQIEKIFQPFFTTKDVGKGTGLGLSVSATIIKHLGGSISVESIVGKGTTFVINFPINNSIIPN